MITREEMAGVLRHIAQLLELKGENPFKIRAYENGADIVETFSGDFPQRAMDNDLKGIKGIGDALADKLHELATTGKLEYYEKLRAEFPNTIFDLFDIPGLGGKKIKVLHKELGIDSVPALKAACQENKVAGLSGFGKKSEERILEAIAHREQYAERHRLADVAPFVELVLDYLKSHPDCSRAEVAGSYRRSRETVHDLDFIVASPKPEAVLDDFVEQSFVKEVIAHGPTKASVYLEDGLQCDVRVVSNDEYACALVYFTGSKEHNVVLRGRANDQGYTLNEYRLAPKDETDKKGRSKAPAIHTESDLYEALCLHYVPPELRENHGEFEALEDGGLPTLIELENLRGTFHNHTTASDGKSTLEAMAEAAQDLGLQYLGIADHSKSSFQANGLDAKRLRQQIEAIGELNDSFGKDFRLFAGSEVDILKDGSLDFDDDLLGELDYAVASVHNVFNLTEAEMTKRIIKAIEHPGVTMLGHLTGRLLLRREPYAVNIPAIIDAAADTGTIIELNANPWRLDMDWRWWQLAKEKGVKCAINPDAHQTGDLQYLYFGVQLARKGWLTRDDVINCLPLGKIEKVLAAKRKG